MAPGLRVSAALADNWSLLPTLMLGSSRLHVGIWHYLLAFRGIYMEMHIDTHKYTYIKNTNFFSIGLFIKFPFLCYFIWIILESVNCLFKNLVVDVLLLNIPHLCKRVYPYHLLCRIMIRFVVWFYIFFFAFIYLFYVYWCGAECMYVYHMQEHTEVRRNYVSLGLAVVSSHRNQTWIPCNNMACS